MNPSIMCLIWLSPYPFIFISICYVFGVTLNMDQLEIISTLLLIPSLSLFYISNSKRNLVYELILVFLMDREFLDYVRFVCIFYRRGHFFLVNYIAYFWSYSEKIIQTDERTVEKERNNSFTHHSFGLFNSFVTVFIGRS